jgi:ABC-type nickel/cobalt efflux system permease component RcnA
MPAKPNSRNWNDVQTAIAAVAIVTTLGLWNLVATPKKIEVTQPSEPTIPPTEPPMELAPATAPVPTAMPQVKIMFAQATPQTSIVQQIQQQIQTVKKKKNRTNSSGGTVTQTKSS